MSDIIKSNFVSFSDQKKTIKTIDNSHPKILQSSVKATEQSKHSFEDFSHSGMEHYTQQDNSLDAFKDDDLGSNELSNDRYSDHLHEITQQGYQQDHQQGYQQDHQQGYQEGYQVGYQEGSTIGYNEGYAKGQLSAQEELNAAIVTIQEDKQKELNARIQDWEDEYSSMKQGLEPKMLSIIERLIKKIIGVHSLNKGTIMYLIRCGLDELELHGDLIIKVSAADIDFVLENKLLITENLSEKIQVEVLKDLQLVQNECVIETDMGTIDCSLGVQLEGLMKELRLIRDSLLNDL